MEGGENGDASGAFIGAKELVKRPVSRYCLFFSAVGGVGEIQARENGDFARDDDLREARRYGKNENNFRTSGTTLFQTEFAVRVHIVRNKRQVCEYDSAVYVNGGRKIRADRNDNSRKDK